MKYEVKISLMILCLYLIHWITSLLLVYLLNTNIQQLCHIAYLQTSLHGKVAKSIGKIVIIRWVFTVNYIHYFEKYMNNNFPNNNSNWFISSPQLML